MKAEYINPFVTATRSVFATMLSLEVTRGPLELKSGSNPLYHVSGVIGLSGRAAGVVVLSLGRETAINATERMLGDRPDAINPDVIDCVGELTNMIAGHAKAQLEQLEMSISLPSVICGKNHTVKFPSASPPITIPFDTPWGPICIEVGLVDTPPG